MTRDDPYRFVIGAMIILTGAVGGFTFIGVAPLFPALMEEFGVERATVALLSSGVLVSILVMRIPAGIIAGRVGLSRIYALGSILASCGGLGLLANKFLMLLGTRVFLVAVLPYIRLRPWG